MTTPLEPKHKTVKIGYMLTKARQNFDQPDSYLVDALIEAELHHKILVQKARARGIIANEHDFAEGFRILYNALHAQIQYRANPGAVDYARMRAAAWSIGEAHKAWADVVTSYGYRPITLDDFLEFGDGGGR